MNRRFDSLRALIESKLSDLMTSANVPGIALALPHLKRVDFYAPLGQVVDKILARSMTWMSAQREGAAWACYEIGNEVRDQFLTEIQCEA